MIRHLPMIVSMTAFMATTPAIAQDHSMQGMQMPGAQSSQPEKPQQDAPQADQPVPARDDMPGMDHSGHDTAASPAPQSADTRTMEDMPDMEGMDHSGHNMGGASGMQMVGTALPVGNTPPPPAPTDHYADRDFPAAEMAQARSAMMKEPAFSQLLLNIFEYQVNKGHDGYRWEGEGWYGGDINRLWIKSEGEGEFGRGIDTAEVQALYSHAIDPYFNLQGGVRQDFGRGPDRTYATIGFEGLAPGYFEVEGALFLSTKGDLLGRVEGYYDQRITQRLVFQPSAELNFSAQNVPENDIGSGLVNFELGGRLRYEISRQFAPYVGISYLQKTGNTARLARRAGEDVHATSFVAGIRFWF